MVLGCSHPSWSRNQKTLPLRSALCSPPEDMCNLYAHLGMVSVQILLMPRWKLNLCHLAASKEAKPSKAGRRGRARCRCCCFVRRQLHQQWLQLPENKQIRGHLIYPDTLKNPTNPTNKGFLFQLTSVLTCKPLRSLEAAEQEARPIWHPQLPRILMFVPRR